MPAPATRALGRYGIGLALAIQLAACGEDAARLSAESFCAAHPVGSPFADAVVAARDAGEKALRHLQEDRVTVGFSVMLYSRHLCVIRGTEGRVSAADYVHLD